eukprot:Pgem_evm1s14026
MLFKGPFNRFIKEENDLIQEYFESLESLQKLPTPKFDQTRRLAGNGKRGRRASLPSLFNNGGNS